MKLKINTYVRFGAIVLTLVAIIGHYYVPKKRLLLYPSETTSTALYGFNHPDDGPSASWVDRNTNKWSCDFKPENDYGCGFSLSWDPDFVEGLDFSKYDGFNLSLDYEGESPLMRIYLRNFNPAYATVGDGQSTKFMSVVVGTHDFSQQSAFVSFSTMSVAEWWVRQRSIPWQLSGPELDRIVIIGFDHTERGLHKVRVNQVELVGDWINTETLLLVIVLFWMLFIVFEVALKFYMLKRKSKQEEALIDELVSDYQKLSAEKDEFELLSLTDSLTGVLNRSGIAQYANRLFDEIDGAPDLGIMIFDIDYFKGVNDQYGHDVGDRVLKSLTAVISENIRAEDVFARWGGEEFVLLCPKKSMSNFMGLAEKLRVVVERYQFEPALKLRVTVSIGASSVRTDDSFEDAFKRADNALYKAKNSGRNCVEFES